MRVTTVDGKRKRECELLRIRRAVSRSKKKVLIRSILLGVPSVAIYLGLVLRLCFSRRNAGL